jgi:AcrR family transcriptional regulator
VSNERAGGESGFERRTRKKRELILDTAIELFGKQGIKKVAVSELAEAAEVSQVTIYKYFTDKAGLVEAALFQIIHTKTLEYRETFALDLPFMERFDRFLKLKTDGAREYRGDTIGVLYTEYPDLVRRLTEERRRLFVEVTAPFLDEGRALGLVDPTIGNETILVYIDILTAGFAARTDIVTRVFQEEGLFEELKRLIFFGFMRGEKAAT